MTAQRPYLPWLCLGLLFAGLVALSWHAWANPIADGGREMYVPWRVADGDMLYRDLFFVYGPIVPYWHALLFRTFGVHLNVLYASGLLVAWGTIGTSFLLARRILPTGLALAAAALVAVSCVFHPSANNCVFPYSFNASYAALANLLAGWLLVTADDGHRRGRYLAGALCVAWSALAKQEFGAGALLFFVVHLLWCWRRGDPQVRATLRWSAALAFGLPAIGYGLFAWQVGPQQLVTESLWPARMLSAMSHFERYTVGSIFDLRLTGRLVLQASAMLAALVTLVAAAYACERRVRRAGLLLVFALTTAAVASPFGRDVNDFLYQGRIHLTNVLVLIAAATLAWRMGGAEARDVGWIVLLAVAQTWRSPLFGGVQVYSAFVLPAGIVLLVWLLGTGLARASGVTSPAHWQRAVLIVCVTWCAVTLTIKARVFRTITYPVTTARGALSVHPSVGPALAGLLEAVASRTSPDDRILLLPEDNAVHFLAGRRSVSHHYQLIPGILDVDGERGLIATAEREQVRFASVSNRMTADYGVPFFGIDYYREIGTWLRTRFQVTQRIGNQQRPPTIEPGLLFPRDGYGIEIFERSR